MFIVGIIMKVLGFFGGANFGNLITGVTDVMKNKTNADVANQKSANEAGVVLGQRYLDSVDKSNEIKLENKRIEGKWGPTLIVSIIFFTIPIGIHFSGIVFDSMHLFGHIPGSWDVKKLPDDFHQLEIDIIKSLFYIGGGTAAVSMLAKAFIRR